MTKLHLYNTLHRKKEIFSPLTANKALIYACGVTTYDHIHLGHARSALICEMLSKLLQYLGYEVCLVKNFTDIDDRIIERAKQRGCSWQQLSQQMIESHNEDLKFLGISPVQKTPKASDHIGDMITIIKDLLSKDLAYVSTQGDVYFRTTKMPNYGQLSNKKLDQLVSGTRVDVEQNKQDPLDFALWKAADNSEKFFQSPWGNGRPGWHIECSAMIYSLLGKTIDIHLGGLDLIFPHHENEIAQTKAFCGCNLASYWLHHGLIRVNNQKMSKSLGNALNIKELKKQYHPEVLKFYLASTHYRQEVEYSKQAIEASSNGLDRLYQAISGCYANQQQVSAAKADPAFIKDFINVMSDDMNTPQAIALMFDACKIINKQSSAISKLSLVNGLLQAGKMLNFLQEDPQQWFKQARIKEVETDNKEQLTADQINQLIIERQQARKMKDFNKADQIRLKLLENKIQILDGPNQTTWQKIN